MSRSTRRTLVGALPPYRLVPRLGTAPGTCAVDCEGPHGWGSGIGGSGLGISLLARSPEVVFAGGPGALRDALRWRTELTSRGPGSGVLFAALSYDLGRSFQPVPERALESSGFPDAWLCGFRAVYRYDPTSEVGEVRGSDPVAVDRLYEELRGAIADEERETRREIPLDLPRGDARLFCSGVERIQEWIRAGDVYQVNLSRRLDLGPTSPEGTASLYRALTRRAGAPFSAYLDGGDFRVVSNSPERFLRVEGDRVETCPIKGTRPRGRTRDEDRWQAKELVTSFKDRAEHVMIVDLERNDLGRVCRIGSVRVDRLCELRSYPTVHHLVSSVQGRLEQPGDIAGLIEATFPGGSITGAPKIRAMQIIESLEPVRRGLYTGAIGWLDADGGLDLSIAIRTAVESAGRLSLHLGAGIVADSQPEAELAETHDKGRAFVEPWRLRS